MAPASLYDQFPDIQDLGTNRSPVATELYVGPLTIDHAHQLARVQIASWWAAYATLLPKTYLDTLLTRNVLAEWQGVLQRPNHMTLGLWCNTELIGFLHFGPPRDGDCPFPSFTEIHTFYLLRRFWGRAFGRLLLDQAIEKMKHARNTHCVLWALAKNQRANHFYERQGFQWDGQLRRERVGEVAPLQVRYRRSL